MTTELGLDLRAARRKAGYVQRDIAHLLGRRQSVVSELERGRRLPTIPEIVTLSLIYGRTFEGFYSELTQEARRDLAARLETLPKARRFAGTFNRAASLERLAQRLEAENTHHGGA